LKNPEEAGSTYKRILVPLDGSELAKKAFDHAEKLAETFDAETILFQVIPFMPMYGAPELVTPFFVDEKQKFIDGDIRLHN
jgi:nucleotide-binding universal stress UspA family protein